MKTTEQYIKEIENTPYRLVGEYLGSRTKAPHLCTSCNEVWEATPTNITNKTRPRGCPRCKGSRSSKNQRLGTEKYKERLIETPYVLLGEYKNAKTPTPLLCMGCSNVWSPSPDSIKSGKGCPTCQKRKSAYKIYKNQETILYLVEVSGEWVKPGLTKESVNRRYKNDDLNITSISEVIYKDGYEAFLTEEWILNSTIKNQIYSNIRKKDGPLTGGNTEIRDYSIKSELIDVFKRLPRT